MITITLPRWFVIVYMTYFFVATYPEAKAGILLIYKGVFQ